MIHAHASTVNQRVHWVSELITEEAGYGVVSQMSRKILGEQPQELLAMSDPAWRVPAARLLETWNQVV